jgi:tyrosyl-tRNA synthetase
VVAGWVARIRDQLSPFVTYTGDNAATLVNNLDWTGPTSVIEFLRDVGKHFPVNKMLARDVVRNRLESGISFTEFSYQLLQANDFYQLHLRHGCQLQFGGSDQWGNITAGVDFVRRRGAGPVHAFTTPLVLKADGTKFGKERGGAVWLDPAMTSPYAFYQFWMNADDRDIISTCGTSASSPRGAGGAGEGDRGAAAGPAGAARARRGADRAGARPRRARAGDRGQPGAVRTGSLDSTHRGHPAGRVAEAGLFRYAVSCRPWSRCCSSRSASSANEARRTIAEGGAYVNNERVTDGEAVPRRPRCCTGGSWCYAAGKRTFAGVELVK